MRAFTDGQIISCKNRRDLIDCHKHGIHNRCNTGRIAHGGKGQGNRAVGDIGSTWRIGRVYLIGIYQRTGAR